MINMTNLEDCTSSQVIDLVDLRRQEGVSYGEALDHFKGKRF